MVRALCLGLTLSMACGGGGSANDSADGGTPSGDAATTPDAEVVSCPAGGAFPGVCPARGVYSDAQLVELGAPEAAEAVYYTLDGSEPSADNGTLYTEPFSIAGSAETPVVVLRVKADSTSGTWPIATHSYVFSEFVVNQPVAPTGVPTTWGNGNTRTGDYEMDPDVLVDDETKARAAAALADLPTVAVTTETDNLWSVEQGIYMNPDQEGIAWERPISVEIFGGGLNVQAHCGLRIQGGSSTSGWKSAKLSMRLKFRNSYGPGKLHYPLFPDSNVEEFDTLVLDAHLNQTWTHPSHGQRIRADFIRDRFIADLQNSIGGTAPHGRFVHLYLNGLYWGLYELHERPDHAFSEDYFGGVKDDYDSIRHGHTLVNGTWDAWSAMLALVRTDLSVQANYDQVAAVIDIDNFIDYMLVNFYGGNTDWPHHNWYTGRHRTTGMWRFYSWDAEHVLKGLTEDSTDENDNGTPGEIYQALRANPGFVAKVEARAQELVSAGAALYVADSANPHDPSMPANNRPAALFQARSDEIASSVLLESARWGDNRRADEPYTETDWQNEINWLNQTYFPGRTEEFQTQMGIAP